MEVSKFNSSGEYLVKQSKSANYFFGILLIIVFVISFLAGDHGWINYIESLLFLLIPGVVFLAVGRRNKTVISINRLGLFYYGKLVTNWKNFSDARLIQELETGDINEKHYLQIRYFKTNQFQLFGRKLFLSSTLDKADAEIIEAIKFYQEKYGTVNQGQNFS